MSDIEEQDGRWAIRHSTLNIQHSTFPLTPAITPARQPTQPLNFPIMRRLTFALFLILFATSLIGQTPPRPDLVVVISIDQFPYYYITRFQPWFGPDGFNRV